MSIILVRCIIPLHSTFLCNFFSTFWACCVGTDSAHIAHKEGLFLILLLRCGGISAEPRNVRRGTLNVRFVWRVSTDSFFLDSLQKIPFPLFSVLYYFVLELKYDGNMAFYPVCVCGMIMEKIYVHIFSLPACVVVLVIELSFVCFITEHVKIPLGFWSCFMIYIACLFLLKVWFQNYPWSLHYMPTSILSGDIMTKASFHVENRLCSTGKLSVLFQARFWLVQGEEIQKKLRKGSNNISTVLSKAKCLRFLGAFLHIFGKVWQYVSMVCSLLSTMGFFVEYEINWVSFSCEHKTPDGNEQCTWIHGGLLLFTVRCPLTFSTFFSHLSLL